MNSSHTITLKINPTFLRLIFLLTLTLSPINGQSIAPPPAATNAAPVKAAPLFDPTALLDITGKRDFSDLATITDDTATQLQGLCSLASQLIQSSTVR